MHTPMTAPAQTSSYAKKEKSDNLELVPRGMNSAIIYGVINVGTQDGEYQGRATANNKLKLVFEIPGHRQLYWKDDTIPSPSAMIMDFNYSVSKNKKSGKKSKLLELIESLFGPLQESQYLSFDISQLAGKKVFINVVHYTKQNGEIGAKIDSVSEFNPAYGGDPNLLVLTNDIHIYSVQMGFENMSYAKLPFFYRTLVKESHEGKAHIAAGGRFMKLDESGNLVIDDGSSNYASVPLGKLVMTGQYTYEQLSQAGWTDQAMIDNGHAKREAAVPTPQAPQMAPTPIPAPIAQQAIPQAAPMAIQPQMPLAQSNPTQPMLTMIDKSASYDDFIKAGWTDALLVQHGKAMMMPAANDVFPQAPPLAPPVQAPPVAIPQAVPQGIPAPQPSASAMFNQAPVAPVQQMGAVPQAFPQGVPQAIPQAPISSFEQPSAMGAEAPEDDLPF